MAGNELAFMVSFMKWNRGYSTPPTTRKLATSWVARDWEGYTCGGHVD